MQAPLNRLSYERKRRNDSSPRRAYLACAVERRNSSRGMSAWRGAEASRTHESSHAPPGTPAALA
eukprot:5256589-Prymnesium_polylepis.1